jgi:hypothetical protein
MRSAAEADETQEAEVNTNVLLGTAAVGLLIAGGAAYTMRSEPARSDQQVQAAETKPPPRTRVERVMDPAGVSTSAKADQARLAAQEQPQKNVRVVYPNVQSFDPQPQPSEAQQSAQPSPTATTSSPPAASADNTPSAQPSTISAQPSPPPQSTPTVQPSASPAPASKGIVALNAQQQTQAGQALAQRNIAPLTNVNFSIAIGTQVPRSVQLRALPSDLVALVPNYRGYSYFVVEEQIMIVEPASHEIVAIVPYTGGANVTPAPTTVAKTPAPTNSRPVSLNTEQREVSKKPVKERKANKPTRERSKPVEEQVRREVVVESEPRRESSPKRRDRFVREDDDVMLIDPDDEDRVVEPRKPFFSGWR